MKKIEIDKKDKTVFKKIKLYLALFFLAFSISLTLLFIFFYKISQWYDKNRVVFQQPVIIKIQPPFRIEKRNASTKEKKIKKKKEQKNSIRPQSKRKLTEREIINSRKHAEVLWKIYGLETSWGKNDFCRISGRGWGGFGVMDGREVVCYESFEKAVERAEYWLVKNGIDEDLPTALCLWNTGIRQPNCKYYQFYLNL